MSPKRAPLTPAKVGYRAYRGGVRLLTYPARRLPLGSGSFRLSRLILRFQHSLPTELAVRKGDVVVQVGTPNPASLRRFLRATGPSGRVVVVEALPENADRLARAAERMGARNFELIRAAASSRDGWGDLAVSPLWGDHKLAVDGVEIDNDLRPENRAMGRIHVQLVRLDTVLPALGIDCIDYLSVTVNGAEEEVLLGAKGLLGRGRPWARVYAKGHAVKDGQPLSSAIRDLLVQLGYKVIITRGEPSTTQKRRSGDVFAWRER